VTEERKKWLIEFLSRAFFNGILTIAFLFLLGVAEYPTLRWVFVSAVAFFAGIGAWEFFQIVRCKGYQPATNLGIISVLLYIFFVFFKVQGPHPFWEPVWQKGPEIVLAIAFFASFFKFAIKGKEPIVNIATTFLGIVYAAVPLGFVVRIMYYFTYDGAADPNLQGSWWVSYLILVTKVGDMAAYFIGSFIGRTKLAVKVSPNKTVEGSIGGIIFSILASLLICYLGREYGEVFVGFNLFSAAILGLILGVLGQIGDLAESLLKRDANVKDSNMIPGIGGVLDTVDSLIFNIPVVYFFIRIMYS
jgi:phosphatidate cytidylyltransferase